MLCVGVITTQCVKFGLSRCNMWWWSFCCLQEREYSSTWYVLASWAAIEHGVVSFCCLQEREYSSTWYVLASWAAIEHGVVSFCCLQEREYSSTWYVYICMWWTLAALWNTGLCPFVNAKERIQQHMVHGVCMPQSKDSLVC